MDRETLTPGTRQVLLADDDWPILRALKVRVEHAGFVVITASDGISAVVSAREHEPDVAVLDINMPGLDGFGVAEKIALEKPNCKIIFLTANRADSVRARAEALGAIFIEKPFGSKQLTEQIILASGTNAA